MHILLFAAGLALAASGAAAGTTASHGISLLGEVKNPPEFTHLSYVNPNAPKGGELVEDAIGSFDSLHPFIARGEVGAGSGAIYDSLMASVRDEPSTSYGLLAKSVEVPDDVSWVIFNLRPEARWHDGSPLTANDVVFTFNILREKGRPLYRYYYANVAKAEALGPHQVKFHFSGPKNRELPSIMGQLAVLPQHWWKDRDFERTTLDPPLGSGPYRITKVDPPLTMTIERVKDYWGQNVPVMRGRNNFDVIRYEYYRDTAVAMEAFKAHRYDIRSENSAKNWATAYDFPAAKSGLVVKEAIPHSNPSGMQAFVFNTRKPMFQDRRVRYAIAHSFDFEWANKNLFYGQYVRTDSYFANSDYAARELPSADEVKLLEPYKDKIPPEVFTTVYQAPRSDGSGQDRAMLRKARDLLTEAGWTIKDGKLVDKDGKHLEFEVLLVQPDFERVLAPMRQPLERLGITMKLRVVDSAQYINRLREFDFDMVVSSWGQSLSPGNEQRDFWSAAAADRKGSRNLIGIKDPAIDALIEQLIAAETRPALIAATRALDRVLSWNHFVIPQFHLQTQRLAYWNRFGRPAVVPKYGVDLQAWWIDPEKDAALKRGEAALPKQ
jgi:microcin C transport system substrate-binding protein